MSSEENKKNASVSDAVEGSASGQENPSEPTNPGTTPTNPATFSPEAEAAWQELLEVSEENQEDSVEGPEPVMQDERHRYLARHPNVRRGKGRALWYWLAEESDWIPVVTAEGYLLLGHAAEALFPHDLRRQMRFVRGDMTVLQGTDSVFNDGEARSSADGDLGDRHAQTDEVHVEGPSLLIRGRANNNQGAQNVQANAAHRQGRVASDGPYIIEGRAAMFRNEVVDPDEPFEYSMAFMDCPRGCECITYLGPRLAHADHLPEPIRHALWDVVAHAADGVALLAARQMGYIVPEADGPLPAMWQSSPPQTPLQFLRHFHRDELNLLSRIVLRILDCLEAVTIYTDEEYDRFLLRFTPSDWRFYLWGFDFEDLLIELVRREIHYELVMRPTSPAMVLRILGYPAGILSAVADLRQNAAPSHGINASHLGNEVQVEDEVSPAPYQFFSGASLEHSEVEDGPVANSLLEVSSASDTNDVQARSRLSSAVNENSATYDYSRLPSTADDNTFARLIEGAYFMDEIEAELPDYTVIPTLRCRWNEVTAHQTDSADGSSSSFTFRRFLPTLTPGFDDEDHVDPLDSSRPNPDSAPDAVTVSAAVPPAATASAASAEVDSDFDHDEYYARHAASPPANFLLDGAADDDVDVCAGALSELGLLDEIEAESASSARRARLASAGGGRKRKGSEEGEQGRKVRSR